MRIKNLIIAAVVMAVLIGGYFLVSALNKPEVPAAVPAGDMMIADDDPAKIKEIKYTRSGETIAIKFADILINGNMKTTRLSRSSSSFPRRWRRR